MQKQTGAKDCGLFAIAFALSLAMDIDPCSRVYNQGCLRQELIASIETGVMKPFSSRNQKRKWRAGKITHVPVYCKCRRVEEGLMIVKDAVSGSTRSVAVCQTSTFPRLRTCNGHAWSVMKSTSYILC